MASPQAAIKINYVFVYVIYLDIGFYKYIQLSIWFVKCLLSGWRTASGVSLWASVWSQLFSVVWTHCLMGQQGFARPLC